MPKPVFVYVAGPMRSGLEKGVHAAIKVADELVANGFHPYLPQLQFMWNLVSPKDDVYAFFLPMDFTIIEYVAHALLRLPGESPGSDREVEQAIHCGKPVFHSVRDLVAWRNARGN